MIRYVAKRFLMLIPLVLCITFVVYGLMSLAPGDPATIMLPSNAPQEQKDALNHALGYDRPFLVKYADFVYNLVFKGDFGISYRTQQPIINEFKTRLPISITLAFTSLTLAACIGVPLGVLSAVKQYSLLDTIPSVMALTLSAVPSFWFGMMLIYFLAYKLGLFPSYGMGGLEHWVLPTLTIAVVYAAEILRYTRSSLLETIRADYVRTARAKGVAERTVIWKHAMKNGLLPVVTLLGSSFGAQIGGAIVTENLYNLPGLGTLTLLSINMRDTPTVVATSVIFATLYNIILILVDLMYAFIDPRIKAKYSR
ncbi:MAG: ABC transporter permease [Clostridia bacterium]|nr:ABC transporter permease [Clostridia bacterium]